MLLILLIYIVTSCTLFADTAVTQALVTQLEKQMEEGQVSPEPGPGEGCATLSEQIEFLKKQLSEPASVNNTQPQPSGSLTPGIPLSPPVNALNSPRLDASRLEDIENRLRGIEARLKTLEDASKNSSS